MTIAPDLRWPTAVTERFHAHRTRNEKRCHSPARCEVHGAAHELELPADREPGAAELRVTLPSACSKASKIRCCSAAAMPTPVSVTENGEIAG
jgi:hypothetical protein